MCNSVELLQNQYRRGPPGLGLSSPTPQYSQRGAPLVGHTGPALEQQGPEAPTSSIEDPNRCLVNRLGCSVQQQQDWGTWTLQESTFHINYLELLAAFLAIKTFAKGQEDIQIDLQMDNMSTLTYINKRGGTQSPSLTILAKECWMWCMDRRITLTALTRETKRYCRRGIPDNQGLLGLDAESNHFRSDTVSSGADGHRSVCIKDNSPTPSLEARNLLSIKENK